jgi:hypothetical protein
MKLEAHLDKDDFADYLNTHIESGYECKIVSMAFKNGVLTLQFEVV